MSRLTAKGIEGALFRYQVMANIVGTLIIILFTFFFIKLATGDCSLEVEIFGVGHGYLYIVYLVVASMLALKARLHLGYVLCMAAAGLVPTMTFVVERWILRIVRTQMAADNAPGDPAAR